MTYVIVEGDSILQDRDTPGDYLKEWPGGEEATDYVNFGDFSGMIDS